MTARIRTTLLAAAMAALIGCAGGAVRDPSPAPAPAIAAATTQPVVEIGTLQGAPYRITLPAGWNGELVVNAHGYENVGSPRQEPWPAAGGMQPLLARGFAVAESGYSAQGWAIGEAIADTERLRAHFVARHGAPRRAWLVGWSMGGLVALASAERHARAWNGVVAMCGVGVSSETALARAVLAPLAAFDALYPGVLPQAPDGLADAALPGEADGDAIEAALAGDEARAGRLAQRFDLQRGDMAGALWLYYVVLRDAAQRAGGFPVDSAPGADGADGDAAALGVRIRRYTADPRALASVRASGALTGDAPVPVVMQPNATDPIVPARFSSGYLALAEGAGRGDRVRMLPGVGQGHCRFAPESVVTALDTVRAQAQP